MLNINLISVPKHAEEANYLRFFIDREEFIRCYEIDSDFSFMIFLQLIEMFLAPYGFNVLFKKADLIDIYNELTADNNCLGILFDLVGSGEGNLGFAIATAYDS